MSKKSKYETNVLPFLDKIELWAENGLTDKEICERLKVPERSWYRYVAEMAVLAVALTGARAHKENRDFDVVRSIYKSAHGEVVQLRKDFKVKRTEFNEKGFRCAEYEELVPGIEEVYIPPNEKACEYILNNRLPERWSRDGERAAAEVGGDKAGNALAAVKAVADALSKRKIRIDGYNDEEQDNPLQSTAVNNRMGAAEDEQ